MSAKSDDDEGERIGVWKGEPSARDDSTSAIAVLCGLNASLSITERRGRWLSAAGGPPLCSGARAGSTCVAVAEAIAGEVGLLWWCGLWIVGGLWVECWGSAEARAGVVVVVVVVRARRQHRVIQCCVAGVTAGVGRIVYGKNADSSTQA